ncbi:n19m, NADH-ubiquinone oxidoreductase 9.5 kDa subunit [Gnomoniopsis sp. IMI 355080]|nr:n19m, NADH-ubiquinone oxidoreductase 9.5 kDa subunit [Gnomoniopsis sp. IMI 355080]
MSGGAPLFWQQPLRYWRWAARERPALFWSCIIGGAGPVMLAVVPPIRHRLGDPDAKPIPMTYPIPPGPRKQLTGYDDDTEQ